MPYLLPERRPIVPILKLKDGGDIDKNILLVGISYDHLTFIFEKINEHKPPK